MNKKKKCNSKLQVATDPKCKQYIMKQHGALAYTKKLLKKKKNTKRSTVDENVDVF